MLREEKNKKGKKIPSEKTKTFKNFWNAAYLISSSQLIIVPMQVTLKNLRIIIVVINGASAFCRDIAYGNLVIVP